MTRMCARNLRDMFGRDEPSLSPHGDGRAFLTEDLGGRGDSTQSIDDLGYEHGLNVGSVGAKCQLP